MMLLFTLIHTMRKALAMFLHEDNGELCTFRQHNVGYEAGESSEKIMVEVSIAFDWTINIQHLTAATA